MLIDVKTDELLETTDCKIPNPRETETLKIKVLLGPVTKQNVAI